MSGKPNDLEKQLIRAIHASGLTQVELQAITGVHQGQLSRFLAKDPEKRRTLSLATAGRLCKALGLELVPRRKGRKPKKGR